MASNDTHDKKISFKDTLNLPKTDFPMQPNAKIDDPAMIERWQQENLFHISYTHNEGKQKFILHDGPPYANGHLHLGHAYNNILKDIVTKSRRMQGMHVPVKPGWDCHGLPIELKVTQENPGLKPQELKKACRAYAQKWIDIQRKERRDLGVLMDWQHPYTTMAYDYEANILRAFGTFVADGYIERKNKTVPWCWSCQTVLASAEIEYQDRKDPSVYVLFTLMPESAQLLFPEHKNKDIHFLVWTTTPWTLPLNRALALNPTAIYQLLDINGELVVVGKDLADKICAMLGIEKKVVAEISAQEMQSRGLLKVHHPFDQEYRVPIIFDEMVSLEDGTACVHNAPGCGPQDYEVAIKHGLDIYSPLTPDGKYAATIIPQELSGMSITDGQWWVLKQLAERGKLIHKHTITHSYPHCWRCHHGLMFRATKQWFCDLSKGGLKQHAIEAVDTITMIPEKTGNRLKATLEGRLEWCLSRQRIWGVPIPAFMCTNCDYTYVTQGLVEKVAQQVEDEGIEYWDKAQPHDLMPQNFVCPLCKGTEFKKEQDILDVWFDSGISHFAVLVKEGIGFPADIYLEGKDQHRGWFQSSLLTAMVLEGKAPMKTILTHGFTVDDKGRKMSKSLGNGVEPQEIINEVGTDGLRLWASSIDCSDDAVVSKVLLQNVKEVYRKIRNTSRFLLSNLYDFDRHKDAVAFDDMLIIDRYAMHTLHLFNQEIINKYDTHDFTALFHRLADYCAVELSAFYLDIIKDRLYVEKADGHARRSAQTACWYILDTMTRLMAPLLSFTAEHISDFYQRNKKESIHLQNFAATEQCMWAAYDQQQWHQLKNIRSGLLKAIEELRAQGVIKHSLEAQLNIYFERDTLAKIVEQLAQEMGASGQTPANFFKDFLIVSDVTLAPDAKGLNASTECHGLYVKVEQAVGDKCPRCWQWTKSQNEHKLCSRCAGIVGSSRG